MAEPDRLRHLLAGNTPIPPIRLYNLGIEALDLGLFAETAARMETAIAQGGDGDYRLWQLLGLARREMLDAAGAEAAFARAALLAPHDPLIAHSQARAASEAGLPAVGAYRRALALAPTDAGAMLGLAAARIAEGDSAGARADLADTLDQHPGWYDGHAAYARFAALGGEALSGTVERALCQFPLDPALWRVLIRIHIEARDYVSAIDAVVRARTALGEAPEWNGIEAMCLSESGAAARAQALFDRLPAPARAIDAIHRVRNYIRLGELEAAVRLTERRFGDDEDSVLWPYRALLWRVVGDDRWHWLEGDPRLIGVYDLAAAIGDIGELAAVLRKLHGKSGTMLGQSVRGGTQTDGHLLARSEPALRHLRSVLHEAVSAHVAQLPAAVDGHPTLISRRAPVRFAGAWSVRLTDSGFHIDHVHPQGWLSSACYIALPGAGKSASAQDGWLALGECRDLFPDLEAFRMIEPEVGRLVLFPSTMWHGTRPFSAGERMTVAFDIARP